MHFTTQSKFLSMAMVCALAACSSTDLNSSDSTASTSPSGSGKSSASYGAEATGTPPSTSTANSQQSSMANAAASGTANAPTAAQASSPDQAAPTTSSSMTTMTMAGTVQQIEQMSRQDANAGVGTVAGAAVGGTMAGNPDDRVYRITLRMDDGSLKAITQETAPSFHTGDRVHWVSGTLQTY